MRTARQARLLAHAMQPVWGNDPEAPVADGSLERKAAQARKEMGEKRWAELMKEWEE